MLEKTSYWDYLPKSSGLGKVQKAAQKKVKAKKRSKPAKGVTKAQVKAIIKSEKKKAATKPSATPRWKYWGSREFKSDADVAASGLRRHGYHVKSVKHGDYYDIYTKKKKGTTIVMM